MISQNFIAGPAIALMLDEANNLLGVAKTLSDSTLGFTNTAEEVRGGPGNMLYGRYFHDAGLTVSLTDIMFGLEYVGFITGTNPTQGGIVLKEEQLTVATPGSLTISESAVAFNGAMIGWYKKPNEANWSIGAIDGNTMTIPRSEAQETYCVKYFWQNMNARTIKISAQYVPKVIHLILINDLFPGDKGKPTAISATSPKAGRLITDIPRFSFDGTGDLTLEAASAATVPLTGSALAVSEGDNCEEEPYYATMVEEIFNAKWQDNVRYIAVEGGDVDLKTNGTETVVVRAIFADGSTARMPNSEFTFAKESKPAATATGVTVGANDGIIKAGTQAGEAVISVNLTGYTATVEPAYIVVTVTGG